MVIPNMKMFLVLLLLKSSIDAKPVGQFPQLDDNMIELMRTCFADRLETVITTQELGKMFIETSRIVTPIPIIVIDENFKSNDVPQYLSQLATFVLATQSTRSFEMIFQTVKSSLWWNIDALVLIIGNFQEGCKPASDILKHSWNMNLLSSLFMCYEQNEGVMLYTYNPYTRRAPHPWKEIEEFNGSSDRWTLYSQYYIRGKMNCSTLNFDKTKFMDGYEIKGIANPKRKAKWSKNTSYNIDTLVEQLPVTEDAYLFMELFPALNITLIMNYDHPGYFENGTAVGFLPKFIAGLYDISLSSRKPSNNFSGTYPIFPISTRILTQQRNFLLPEEKLLSFYSKEILYLTSIVLIITFVFILVIYKKWKFSSAAFDILRLLVSTSLMVPLNRTVTKIYFFGVLQLIIILNATFQGHLSAFLTKPERRYINSVKDLQIYDYNIYSLTLDQEFLDSILIGNQSVHYAAGIDCTEDVISDSTIACIEIPARMIEASFNHDLHISESEVAETLMHFWCRNDWSLKRKFNIYLSRLIEAGVYNYWREQKLNIPLEKLRMKEMDETAVRYRQIKVEDLAFAFRFAGFGIATSIVVFVIQMFPLKIFVRVMKKMKRKYL